MDTKLNFPFQTCQSWLAILPCSSESHFWGRTPLALIPWLKAPVGGAWRWLLSAPPGWGTARQEAARHWEINHDDSGRNYRWISAMLLGTVQMEVGVKWSFAGWSCFCTTYWSPWGGRKRETAAPCWLPGVAGGRGQVGVCGPPQLAVFRCTIRYCSCIPPVPGQCKGQITKQGWAGSTLCSVFAPWPRCSRGQVLQILWEGAVPMSGTHRPSLELRSMAGHSAPGSPVPGSDEPWRRTWMWVDEGLCQSWSHPWRCLLDQPLRGQSSGPQASILLYLHSILSGKS